MFIQENISGPLKEVKMKLCKTTAIFIVWNRNMSFIWSFILSSLDNVIFFARNRFNLVIRLYFIALKEVKMKLCKTTAIFI